MPINAQLCRTPANRVERRKVAIRRTTGYLSRSSRGVRLVARRDLEASALTYDLRDLSSGGATDMFYTESRAAAEVSCGRLLGGNRMLRIKEQERIAVRVDSLEC